MKWQQTPYGIVQHFHAFNHRESFVEINTDVLTKEKFPVKDKAKIFPSILQSKNRAF